MSKHPTERVRSVQELQATSMQQSDKALRRMAAAEERLARLEGRLAEKDELISEFREAYGRQADTINAMGAVVKELESKIARGVDQVLTGLEGRISKIEVDADAIHGLQGSFSVLADRLRALEAKPKRGRPKGSKNKPKNLPPVESPEAESGQSAAPIGQQPEGEPQ